MKKILQLGLIVEGVKLVIAIVGDLLGGVFGVFFTLLCGTCYCGVLCGTLLIFLAFVGDVFFLTLYAILDMFPIVGWITHAFVCVFCNIIIPLQPIRLCMYIIGVFLVFFSPLYGPILAVLLLPVFCCIGCPILLCPNVFLLYWVYNRSKMRKIVPLLTEEDEDEIIMIDHQIEDDEVGKPLKDFENWGLKPRYKIGDKETEPFRSPAFRGYPSSKVGDPFPEPVNGIGTLTGNMHECCMNLFSDQLMYKFRDVTSYETKVVNNRLLETRGHGEVQQMTYREVYQIILSLASGLEQYCPELTRGEEQPRIGIYLDTCKEWVFAEHAILLHRGVVVTVYANLGFEALLKCVNESELETIVCDESNLERIDNNFVGKCPTVKRLVTVKTNNGFKGNDVEKYVPKNFECKSIEELINEGKERGVKKFEDFENKPQENDLALIMYTSGTTGVPKGVMITHRNVCVGIEAVRRHTGVGSDEVHFTYLPLAHILEQKLHHILIFCGGLICFGHPRTLVAKEGGAKVVGDLAVFQPTILIGVPRVFDTVRKGVLAKVRQSGKMKEKLFMNALNKQVEHLRLTGRKDMCVSTGSGLLFKKVRKMTGGKLRFCVSAGAALSPETQLFLQAVLGKKTNVFQVYGMTENGCLTCQRVSDEIMKTSRVGIVACSTEMKLVSCPEMGYEANPAPVQERSKSGDKVVIRYPLRKGEIWVRGPTITKGYYKKPEKTEEVYLPDGWFRTGDVGQLNLDGTISVIDRIKNLVKLSSGEYVALEHLESIYGVSSYVFPNGICVLEGVDNLVAVVCVDPNFAISWWNKNNEELGLEEIVGRKELKEEIMKEFDRIRKEKELNSWERICNILVTIDVWTPENNMLTASSKLKRREIRKKYQAEIQILLGQKVEKKKEEEEEEEVEGEGED